MVGQTNHDVIDSINRRHVGKASFGKCNHMKKQKKKKKQKLLKTISKLIMTYGPHTKSDASSKWIDFTNYECAPRGFTTFMSPTTV